jgi:hypothetical protein
MIRAFWAGFGQVGAGAESEGNSKGQGEWKRQGKVMEYDYIVQYLISILPACPAKTRFP